MDDKFSAAVDLLAERLLAQEQLAQRLREGLCEVQNVPTRRAARLFEEAFCGVLELFMGGFMDFGCFLKGL